MNPPTVNEETGPIPSETGPDAIEEYCVRWDGVVATALVSGNVNNTMKLKVSVLEFLCEMQMSLSQSLGRVNNLINTIAVVPNREGEECLNEALNGPPIQAFIIELEGEVGHWRECHVGLRNSLQREGEERVREEILEIKK